MKKAFLLGIFSLSSFFLLSAKAQTRPLIFNIIDFGARSDSSTVNTLAINSAIEACHKKGGGTVLVPPGYFVSGTVRLLSNIDLYLSAGAVLAGSKDTADYLANKKVLMNGEGYNRYGLVYANDAQNISISGRGTIDGNGDYFMYNPVRYKYKGRDFEAAYTRQGSVYMTEGIVIDDGPITYPFRPGMLLTLINCSNVALSDVTMRNSPEWTVRLGFCEGVTVKGITITNNQLVPNNDGIHCTVSRNVTISDCNISTGDDAIIVSGFGEDEDKSTAYGNKSGAAENVTVTNCVLSSRSACIRVGYGEKPIRNLVFSNLVMYASNRGIGVFAREQSNIEHVLFSNIIINNRLHSGHWWGKGEPIHISAVKSKEGGKPGRINDIQFFNINATSEHGIVLQGSPESILTNLRFTEVSLQINRGKFSDSYGGNFDFRPAYPLSTALFKHDVPGMYAQYTDGLSFSGFTLAWGENLPAYFTNGLWADHIKNMRIFNCFFPPAPLSRRSAGVQVSNSTRPSVVNSFTGKAMDLFDHKLKQK